MAVTNKCYIRKFGKLSVGTAALNKVFLVHSTQFFLHTLLVPELTNKKNAKNTEIKLCIRHNYEE